MKSNRQTVLHWIAASEGGYSNHPKDPGKATNFGITQATYNQWLELNGLPHSNVLNLSKEVASQILAVQYLDKVSFDNLPAGVDYAVADYAVNSGPARAVKALQRVLGMSEADVDGIAGVRTLAKAQAADPTVVINDLCNQRMAFLKSLPTFSTFGKGWTIRVTGVRTNSLALANQHSALPVVPKEATPRGQGTAKTDDTSVGTVEFLKGLLKDNAAVAGIVGSVAGPVFAGQGPVQYAFAAIAVLGFLVLVYRILKRERSNG